MRQFCSGRCDFKNRTLFKSHAITQSSAIRSAFSTSNKLAHVPCKNAFQFPGRHRTARVSLPSRRPLSLTARASDSESDLGVVIVDHGSKKEASNLMLFDFVELYKNISGRSNVEAAHMEIAEPTISQAVEKCVTNGARKVIVAPYFLSKGRHIQQDIPALVADAQKHFPDVECIVAEPIGVDPLMAQLIDARVSAAEKRR